MPARPSRRPLAALTLSALLCALAPHAGAQTGSTAAPAQPNPTPTNPAQPSPAPAKSPPPQYKAPPIESPYLKLIRRREWTVRAQITLQANYDNLYRGFANFDRFRFESMTMIFPIARSTASSRWRPGSADGSLFLDQTAVDTSPTLIGPYHSGAIYARYDAQDGNARTVRLVHTHEVTAWDTFFNELPALEVPWPTGPWPDDAMSTFGPQEYINPQGAPDAPVADLVSLWTKGQDPKSISPVLLAKWLAGNVQEYVQLEGDGVNRAYYVAGGGIAEGVELKGAAATVVDRRGSPHDMAALLTAVYRAAGLPARVVIGIDDDPERRSREVRSWVEFCLYDEKLDITTWIPVDIARLRARSSRMLPLDRPWEYFGTHDELHEVVPFAFHFIPPVDVRSYNSPAFYGWRQTPLNAPYATQFLDLDVNRTVQRGAPKP